MFFITFATPHLGVRRPQHKRTFNSGNFSYNPYLQSFCKLVPLLIIFPSFPSLPPPVMNFFTGSWFLGKTGRQLVYEDSPVSPILTLLASPHDIFYQGSFSPFLFFSFSIISPSISPSITPPPLFASFLFSSRTI